MPKQKYKKKELLQPRKSLHTEKEREEIRKLIDKGMRYDKTKTFEEAERRLKATQAIKPDKRNYYSKDWYNKHYDSKIEARRAYARASRVYKDRTE